MTVRRLLIDSYKSFHYYHFYHFWILTMLLKIETGNNLSTTIATSLCRDVAIVIISLATMSLQ